MIRRNLIKAVFLAAEADGHEICEELSTAFERRLTRSVTASTEGWCYKVYSYSAASLDIHSVWERISQIESRVAPSGDHAHDSSIERNAWGNCEAGILPLYLNKNMLQGNTGCHEWEAGFYLAEYVLSHAHQFQGRSVLELGCGCGLVAVALARAGVRAALCTDGDEEALNNCQRNLELNGAWRSNASQHNRPVRQGYMTH